MENLILRDVVKGFQVRRSLCLTTKFWSFEQLQNHLDIYWAIIKQDAAITACVWLLRSTVDCSKFGQWHVLEGSFSCFSG
jgi:hypothetical protein